MAAFKIRVLKVLSREKFAERIFLLIMVSFYSNILQFVLLDDSFVSIAGRVN